jgi:fumarylacetoacetate (FAA) hydrolase
MKLGTLKNPLKRDGDLVVVSADNKHAVRVPEIAPSLRDAIENWAQAKPKLEKVAKGLSAGTIADAFAVDPNRFHSPLPRAFQWADGSAVLTVPHHP